MDFASLDAYGAQGEPAAPSSAGPLKHASGLNRGRNSSIVAGSPGFLRVFSTDQRAANKAVKCEVRVLVIPYDLAEVIDVLRESASRTRPGYIEGLDVPVSPPQKPMKYAVGGGVKPRC